MHLRWILPMAMAMACVSCGRNGAARDAEQPAASSADNNSADPKPVRIGLEESRAHRISVRKPLRLRLDDEPESRPYVELWIVVDERGNVASAAAGRGPKEAEAAAVAEAKTWKYKPFERNGKPVRAGLLDGVSLIALPEPPAAHHDFPPLENLDGVVMKLSRTLCFGKCPVYSVEIHGDGAVLFTGEEHVVVRGEHRAQLSRDQVAEILAAYRKADYFSLKNKYAWEVTDLPTYRTALEVGALKKRVLDYDGQEAGMPKAVTDLEETIDRVTDTQKWIKGNAETVPALQWEKFDFHSDSAAEIAGAALEDGNLDVVRALLGQGVGISPQSKFGDLVLDVAIRQGDAKALDMLITAGVGKSDPQVLTSALAEAAAAGNMAMVKALIAYGGDPRGQGRGERYFEPDLSEETGKEIEEVPRTVLMAAASSGDSAVLQAILGAHPDVNATDGKGRAALWYLSNWSLFFSFQERATERARLVHVLVRAGARVNARDHEGNSALHKAFAPEVAKALLNEGARVNLRNNFGQTPLMMTDSLEVAQTLVAAGADPLAQDNKGRTALDYAQDSGPEGPLSAYFRSLQKTKSH